MQIPIFDAKEKQRYPVATLMNTKPIRFSVSILVLVALLLTTCSFSVGFFVGEERATRNLVPDGEGQVTNQGEVPVYLAKDVDFKKFWDTWNYIKEEFYKQPVSDVSLYYGALKGLLSGLDDPYSVYFDPEEAKEFAESLDGSFEGIGAEIGIKDEKLQIVAPLSGSPAEQAGLLPGDWIVLIDGVDTLGMTTEEAVSLIRGEKGTSVTLSISRNGLDSLTEVVITRDTIVIDSVKWVIDENNVMHIGISTFNSDTSKLFSGAVQEALAENVSGIILDLRSNPGGLLTAAIDVASAWVGYDTVVIERTQNEANAFKGLISPRLQGLKTVVLVNGGSASGSEIVTGALQDHGYATIVGTQTFGKGSVQDYQELEDGSAIKITTAEWYTPNGRTINKTGITPDIIVDYTIEEYKQGIDPQYDVASQIILGTYVSNTADTSEENTDTEIF